jgi:hypothetical protein
MLATVRAHSRDVSTSSAATIQSGAFRTRLEPGKMANLALRAPRYSARGRRPEVAPGGADAAARAGSTFMPIWDSRPASRER